MSRVGKVGRERLMLAILLVFGSVVFFALVEQAGTSLNQFAERNTALPQRRLLDRHAGPDPVVQRRLHPDLRAAARLAVGQLGQQGRDPNPLVKFGLGLIQIGVGFLVLVWGAELRRRGLPHAAVLPGFSYLLQTTGELCLARSASRR